MTLVAFLSTIPGWFVFAFLVWGVVHAGAPGIRKTTRKQAGLY